MNKVEAQLYRFVVAMLFFDGSGNKARSDVALCEDEHENNRGRRNHRDSHQVIPARPLLTNEGVETKRERTLRLVGDECERKEKVTPPHQKGQGRHCQQPWTR